MKTLYPQRLILFGYLLISGLLSTGCATQQGYQGAGVGAMTGATAGILLDQDNRWRGGVIGGGLGAILGGALTDQPAYRQRYNRVCASPFQPDHYQSQRNYIARTAIIGGATGAAAGALLDHNNGWRGGLIGGALGSFFGGSVGSINSGRSIPVLAP
jgi:hypothetical protein